MEISESIDTSIATGPTPDTVVAPEPVVVEQQPADKSDIVDPADFYADDKRKNDAEPEGEAETAKPVESEEEPEPIAAPLSWAKDGKEMFESLPREAQEIISKRENERDAFVRAKSQEVVGVRHAVETEARTALQTIMENHQRALHVYATRFDATPPDLRLLASGDENERTLYFQQEAHYRDASAQREQIAQQMSEAEQHAQAIAHHQQQAELQAEHALLEETLGTDWSDPSSRAKLLGDLTPIAAELGYPQELIAQARACDIIAMKHVAELKADADRWRAYNKAKMIPVRAAIGKTIPPTSRPNAPTGQRAPVSVAEQMYPNDVRRN